MAFSTLFTDYLNKFLKVKQKADGWPADVGDDKEKRQKYIHNYHSDEGVLLEYYHIERNPAKCASAKLMLNSFWGKFGKQSNKCQVKTFGSPAKFYQLLNNDELLILSVRVVYPEMLIVVNNHIQEAGAIQPHINIFFACFTTRQARLMSTRPFPHEA